MAGFAALANKLQTGSVTLRGETIPLRALSVAETDRIAELIPRPIPPMGPDLSKGGLAPPIPNEDDPAYQILLREWIRKMQLSEIAVASDEVKLEPLGDLAAAIKRLADLLNPDEMMDCTRALRNIAGGTQPVEAAIKNS